MTALKPAADDPERLQSVACFWGGRSRPIRSCRSQEPATSIYCSQCTVRVTLVVFVMLPPLPVTVMVRLPVWAREPALTDIVTLPEPGAAMEELGLKVIVTLLP